MFKLVLQCICWSWVILMVSCKTTAPPGTILQRDESKIAEALGENFNCEENIEGVFLLCKTGKNDHEKGLDFVVYSIKDKEIIYRLSLLAGSNVSWVSEHQIKIIQTLGNRTPDAPEGYGKRG